MKATSRRSVVLMVCATALLATGALSVRASTGLDASAAPSAVKVPDCVSVMLTADGPTPSLEGLVGAASAILVVDVLEVGKAQWDTPGAVRPDQAMLRSAHALIVRPLTLSVKEVWTGHVVPGELRAYLVGGSVGCDSTLVASPIDVSPGQYVAVAVRRNAGDSKSIGDLAVAEMWAVSDGVVKTDVAGAVPLTAIRQTVASLAP
jgi:hypothetical protein